MTSVASWSGLKLGDYAIEREISRGPFGTTYLGTEGRGMRKVFKTATDEPVQNLTKGSTQAFSLHTGTYSEVSPVGSALLIEQQRLMAKSSCFAAPSAVVRIGATVYYTMDYIEAPTLRDAVSTRTVHQALGAVCDSLVALRRSGIIHGDLKPENVFIDQKRAILIDPGYFGALSCAEGQLPNCVVTTMAYYPKLEPDDDMALGLLAWELVVGTHPFHCSQKTSMKNSEAVDAWFKHYSIIGRSHMRALAELPAPAELVSIERRISNAIMKLIGFDVTSGLREPYHERGALAELQEALGQ